jgi:hypothetical protein
MAAHHHPTPTEQVLQANAKNANYPMRHLNSSKTRLAPASVWYPFFDHTDGYYKLGIGEGGGPRLNNHNHRPWDALPTSLSSDGMAVQHLKFINLT